MKAGRQFGVRSENIDSKKKWWCWCVWTITTVLQKAFSNCYYYIYTYEQPILFQLAPIQTSNHRDVTHYTRIQDQGDLYSGKTYLDSHADTTMAGRNCTVMHDEERSCDVAPFSNRYNPMTNISIITAATGFTSTTGRKYILVFNEALYIKDIDHTLIHPRPLRHFDTEVQDNLYHAIDTMSTTSPNGEFISCLQSHGTNVFLNTWRPTCQFPCSQNCETHNFFAQNMPETIDWLEYQSTRVPVNLSPRCLSVNWWKNYLARFLFVLSPRRLSVDQRWNYSARVRVDSSPQRPSLKIFGSSPNCLSFDWRRNCWLTSQPSVPRPYQPLTTHVLDVCHPPITETKMSPIVCTNQN